jgi:sugar phosphate isomerase/epimerase
MKQKKDIRERLFIAGFSERAAEVAREYGCSLEINEICISENLDEERLERTEQRIRSTIKTGGCEGKRVLMHGPFTELTPDAMDPKALKLTWDRYEEAVRLCRKIGIKDIVFHSGYIPRTYHKEWHHARSVEFFQNFCTQVAGDMNIYIENVFDDEPYMIRSLIEDINLTNVRACLDIGHANVASMPEYDVLDWIDVLRPVLGHTHLHDNDGEVDLHLPLGYGTIDVDRVLGKLLAMEDVFMTIESTDSRESLIQLFSLLD